jgi:methionyl-tRNA formyltransferase
VIPLKTVFLGTPQAAVPTLERLLSVGSVGSVITRPDKPRGRSSQPTPSPVKQAAVKNGIPVFEASRSGELQTSWFEDIDVAIVVAFGVLIPSKLLDLPKHGFLNVHFSLLPRWRGAAPVVAAIAAGDDETGVTVMRLDAGLDTGPIVAARSTPIGIDETGGALMARLAAMGAELLVDTLPSYLGGDLALLPQLDHLATHAPRLGKNDSHFDFEGDPVANARQVRALAPRPGVTVDLETGPLRLLAIAPTSREVQARTLSVIDDRVFLGGTRGAWELLEVQPSSGRAMAATDWARGWRTIPVIRA